MPKVGKPKSKRTPVRLRHKIEKASAAKGRKERKAAKKNPEWRSRLKKDPGIPNLFPYKNKILQDIEDSKRRKEEDLARRRGEAKDRRKNGDAPAGVASVEDAAAAGGEEEDEVLMDYEGASDDEAEMEDVDTSNPMAALLASARARATDYGNTNGASDDGIDEDDDDDASSWEGVADGHGEAASSKPKASLKDRDSSRRAYDKAFQEVLSASDVLLYVLDARDPIGTRSPSIEQTVTSTFPDKRLILVLNKIDLIPPHVLKAWLPNLRRSFPTIPLRTTTSSPHTKTFSHARLTPQRTATTLLTALKSYSASKHFKRALTVGIIGYPNTGKSSVINALLSRHSGNSGSRNQKDACPVGAEAGVTTSMRQIKLDSKLRLLDSPGIVFPSIGTATTPHGAAVISQKTGAKHKTEEQARLILLNAIPPHEISDPQPAVSLLIKRLQESEELFGKLKETYSISALMSGSQGGGDITTDFLVQVARQRGRLGKGGVPNLHAAAQTVLSDWRDGRIMGWVEPPSAGAGTASGASGDEKSIVKEWAEEFNLDGLLGDGGEEATQNGDEAVMEGVQS
ncbi:MAG: hypothetical protein M1828_002768 [Chrysothrix sp. TS-e1954]|nr:MAG: hypothetical protein M1828_002768 [Chrysothrix sp. TS-e1954]